MTPALVVLDFKAGLARRYQGRQRTHTAAIPPGFSGEDKATIEQFRVQPGLCPVQQPKPPGAA